MDTVKKIPTVFVSSTCYDLSQIREDLKEYLENNYGFEVLMSEFNSFPQDPCKGTFENCLENVDKRADLFILIIGNRYGYVTDTGKSITNLEYLHAKSKGIPIYAFVNKSIYNNLSIWRNNPEADFSAVTENNKVFEFVAGIYDNDNLWVYNFEKFSDIKLTLKHQLSLVFSDGLVLRRRLNTSGFLDIEKQISPESLRFVVEQPYAWKYKFLGSVLLEKFNNLKEKRWNYKYGIYKDRVSCLEIGDFINESSRKLEEMIKLIDLLKVLLEVACIDAIEAIEETNDVTMVIYVTNSIIQIYERIIDWALYFKSLKVEPELEYLVQLFYEMPSQTLNDIEEFIIDVHTQLSALPDEDDGVAHHFNFCCTLNDTNTTKINNEIGRLNKIYS